MSSPSGEELTRLLHEWSSGRADALPRLMELVYPELHKIAAYHLSRERQDHTLQPRALVNEAYLRLAPHGSRTHWENRRHFFAVAARVVRAVLVDHARARLAGKRGSGGVSVELWDAAAQVPAPPVDLLDLDAALSALEHIDPQQSRVVELRQFAGLSIEETAELYIPPPRLKVVLRPRLLELLNEGLQRKLILISAPAGFGKTTLVSEWIAGLERLRLKVRVAWLSLDEGDIDRARFLAYIVAALHTIAPNIGEGVLDALQSPQPPPTESILTILLNEIATIPESIVLA